MLGYARRYRHFYFFDLLQKQQLCRLVGGSKCESDVKATLSRFV